MRTRNAVLSAVLAAGLIVAIGPSGHTIGYLKIGDIKGESLSAAPKPKAGRAGEVLAWSWGKPSSARDDGHKDWIDLQSMSSPAMRPSTGSGNVSIRRYVDKSSPKLAEACANGHVVEEVEISVPASDKSEPYLKYKLVNVQITSYSVAGGDAGDLPTEEISFNYEKVEFDQAKAPASRATGGTAVKPMRAKPATDYNSSRSNKSY